MRTIDFATKYKRDYKREAKGPYQRTLDAEIHAVVTLLLNDEPLSSHHRDHSLGGEWSGYRECHIRPDLLLVYRKPNDSLLYLARLGSHSELFG